MTENGPRFWPARSELRFSSGARAEEGNLRQFWLATLRQFRLVSAIGLVGLLFGAFHLATSPKQYYSSATILIYERHNSLDEELSSLRAQTRNDTGFENQMEILRSRGLAEEVIRRLDLQENRDFLAPPTSVLGEFKSAAVALVRSLLPDPVVSGGDMAVPQEVVEEARIQKAAAMLAARTKFSRIGRSYSVEVGYLSHEPMLARDIADAYAEAYLADATQANLEASDRTAAWMKDQIEEIRRSVLEAAADAERFRSDNAALDQQGLRERLQRVNSLNDLYVTIEARYQAHLIAGTYPVANGRILSQALLPERPSEPKSWQLLLAGLAAGLMVGLGAAVFREMRETAFRIAEDIETEGLAFLGYLPTFRNRKRHTSRPLLRGSGEPVRKAQPHEIVFSSRQGMAEAERAPFVLSPPKTAASLAQGVLAAGAESPYTAAVQGILGSVDLALDDRRVRVIGIAGVSSGAGATTLASTLAHQVAAAGHRTLLIDADSQTSNLTSFLKGPDVRTGPREPGLGDPLRDALRLPEGLDLLPAVSPSVSPVARTSAIREAIESAKTRYDLVVIDFPPISLRTNTQTLLGMLDGLVLVLDWGRTSRRTLEVLLNRHPELRKQAIGAVLNRTDFHALRKYGVSCEECGALTATGA